MLLNSILKRLADTVVFDLVVACERMLELTEPADASAQLTAYQRQLEEAINALPRFEPDPSPTEIDGQNDSADLSRKRAAPGELDR